MIPVDVLNTLKALTQNNKPLVTANAPVAAAAGTAFEPGQQHQAVVQAQISPGIFKVQVAEQVLQMQLPATVRSGDRITLQVVSLLPRLTFTLAAAASSNPLSTPDQLSSTARLLSSLSQQPVEKAFVRQTQSAPLWTGSSPLPDTVELAGKLHETLSQSGLFYESHQAKWLQGAHTTAQLLQEPQNKLSPLPARTAGERAAASAMNNPAATISERDMALSPRDQPAPNQPASVAGSDSKSAMTSIPEHLQPLVQQQLNALETRQVVWQGQVWPKQEMSWEVHEESTRTPRGEEERQWTTQIQLDLPRLGTVNAKLRFGSAGLSLVLEASDSDTRARLGNASSRLVAALKERGIVTTSALVTQHEHA
ncbi:MAG TPA: flagellar hook-length control protein FliK [Gallionellaceae bacterium]|nr:flagellar hook-length control protein FliK [Gallionellaceae bacterium]